MIITSAIYVEKSDFISHNVLSLNPIKFEFPENGHLKIVEIESENSNNKINDMLFTVDGSGTFPKISSNIRSIRNNYTHNIEICFDNESLRPVDFPNRNTTQIIVV